MHKINELLGHPIRHILDRIERYVEQVPFSDCHYWTGGLTRKNGYGSISIREKGNRDNQRSFKVHRLIYEIKKGNAEGFHVLHSCDNPRCVNPDHLSLGTHQDNMREMKERKRHVHGIRSPFCKLSENDIREIRKLYVSGLYSTRKLAAIYGVNSKHIWKIATGQKWQTVK